MRRTVLLLIPILAAGCSAVGQAGAAGSPTPSDRLAPYREILKCIREHGAPNLPDPTFDPQGNPRLRNDEKLPKSAEEACKHLLKNLPPERRSAPPVDVAGLRKLAQCFRQHGVTDWPDPDAQGRFHLNKRLWDLGKRAWLPAREACLQYLPKEKGGLMIEPPPGAEVPK